MHSVGLVEVKVPASSGLKRAVVVAATKGRELGCWVMIEHSVFAELNQASWNVFGARALLAHSPAPQIARVAPPTEVLTTEFDCVLQGQSSSRSAMLDRPRCAHRVGVGDCRGTL